MEPVVKLDFDALRIYINDILHLNIRLSELLGIQSWQWPANFFIEYTSRGGTILTEYTNVDTWISILKQLDKLPL